MRRGAVSEARSNSEEFQPSRGGLGERPSGLALAVARLGLGAAPAQLLFPAGQIHGPVGARRAPVLALLEERLVAAVQQVDLWPVEGRVVVLVVVAVLIPQVARPAFIGKAARVRRFATFKGTAEIVELTRQVRARRRTRSGR